MAKFITQLRFLEWLPDQEDYGNPGSPNVSNALWVNGNYVPALSFSSLGYALTKRCQGATVATDTSESVHIYAGIDTKLYEFMGNGFTDRSGSTYTTQDANYWKFTQFSSSGYGNLLFATNLNDTIQQIAPGASAFANITVGTGTAPKASQIANIGQFVVVGNTQDATNGTVPYRIQWSGINNPTYWGYTTLADQQNQGGQQYMNANYGGVNHISNGGTYGLIFQERAITRMYYVGGDVIFDFSGQIDLQRGCFFPNSAVQIGANIYCIAHDGFIMTDGQSVQQIGHGKIDTTFLNDVNQAYSDRVVGGYDPINKLIYWAYCSSANTTGITDKTITYNYAEGKFSPITQDSSRIFTSASFGYTMDTLDNININLDLISPSLDSPYWEGGNIQIGAFDSSFNYGTLTGAALTATIDTTETDMKGGITYIDGFRPIFEDATGNCAPTVAPLYRMLTNNTQTVGTAASPNSRTGICNTRVSSRYIGARVVLANGFDKALGVDVYGTPAGDT